uniref:Uncharacterized protein n=1 Tax=Fagus sylvatica TaxID=28930 RepID=A0A2N9HP15_FAGSY
MGHAAYRSESPRCLLSNDIKFVQIGVRTRESYGSRKSGCLELFLCIFPVKIPVKRGMLPANREFHVVAGVVIFPTHPGSRINLLRVGKTSLRAKAAVREEKCVFPSAFFLESCPQFARTEIRAWACERYGPANRGHRSVFGPFGGHFSDRGFRLDPVNSWRSESSTSCMNVSSFQRARACGSTCCESGRLCAQAWQRRWEKFRNFQHSLISSACFHVRVVDVAPDVGFRRSWYRRKACATYFSKVQALHRGELGFARYDLANRGRWNVPYAKGGTPVGSETAWSNLGQTWSTLGQTWSNLVKLGKCVPDLLLEGYLMCEPSSDQAGLGSGCLVLRADTRENPGGTAKNLPQFVCHSLSDALFLNRLTHGSKVKVGFRFLVFSQNSTFPTSAFSFPSSSDLALRKSVRPFELGSGKIGIRDLSKSQFGEIRRFGNSESKQVGRIWDLKLVQISNWVVQRFGILDPNTLRGDLAWGLPKSQIEWSNGLAFESKHVGEVNLRLQICSSLKLGGSTVWHLNPNTLRVIWLGDYPSLKSSGPTAWHLNPNTLGRCLIGVVVMIIAASPAFDSCECMNIEDAMRAPFEVVVALSAGSECTRIPYFRLSYLVVLTTCSWSLAHLVGLSDALDHLVGRHFLNLRSAWFKPFDSFIYILDGETFLALAIQNSLFPGFDTVTDLGGSARGVHSPG